MVCGRLSDQGRCPDHRRAVARTYDRARGSSAARGYGYRWQVASKAFLRAHPLCECPECQGGKVRVLIADVVDHRVPHKGDMQLFWNQANWQPMHHDCHNKKTATEDGGFGNARGGGGGQNSAA
jgi:5-methylcytosine-specific restriction protein A